jgi:hypothetical protein
MSLKEVTYLGLCIGGQKNAMPVAGNLTNLTTQVRVFTQNSATALDDATLLQGLFHQCGFEKLSNYNTRNKSDPILPVKDRMGHFDGRWL